LFIPVWTSNNNNNIYTSRSENIITTLHPLHNIHVYRDNTVSTYIDSIILLMYTICASNVLCRYYVTTKHHNDIVLLLLFYRVSRENILLCTNFHYSRTVQTQQPYYYYHLVQYAYYPRPFWIIILLADIPSYCTPISVNHGKRWKNRSR